MLAGLIRIAGPTAGRVTAGIVKCHVELPVIFQALEIPLLIPM